MFKKMIKNQDEHQLGIIFRNRLNFALNIIIIGEINKLIILIDFSYFSILWAVNNIKELTKNKEKTS